MSADNVLGRMTARNVEAEQKPNNKTTVASTDFIIAFVTQVFSRRVPVANLL